MPSAVTARVMPNPSPAGPPTRWTVRLALTSAPSAAHAWAVARADVAPASTVPVPVHSTVAPASMRRIGHAAPPMPSCHT